MAGKPSGIAATAKEIEVKSISAQLRSFKTVPTKNITTAITIIAAVKNFPNWFKLFFNGVSVSSASASIPAIFPTSVAIPVLTTTPFPRPYVTLLLEKAMLMRSPIPTSLPSKTTNSFSTGTDSPVNAASSIFSELTSIKRISAGTTSPASNKSMSPGTNSVLLTFFA